MVPEITYEDKFQEDGETGRWIFDLICGVKVIDGGGIVRFEGTSIERRYYLIHQSVSNNTSKFICTLKKGEVAISQNRWYKVDQITESEFGTYKEFGLFPVLDSQQYKKGV